MVFFVANKHNLEMTLAAPHSQDARACGVWYLRVSSVMPAVVRLTSCAPSLCSSLSCVSISAGKATRFASFFGMYSAVTYDEASLDSQWRKQHDFVVV